ncbi:MAG: hypothetical protein HFF99_08885 [Oscillibacter sp.]|nr:hypothetical protein [uncultured Oscillibacter sp.]MCI8971565.1 hypothetical protein [Oscillibacter sp.]
MKRFLKTYAVCLLLLGLSAVLCMGSPAGKLLLVFDGHPFLPWILAALLPVIPAAAWVVWRERRL